MISCAHRIDIDRYDSASLAARIHLDRTPASTRRTGGRGAKFTCTRIVSCSARSASRPLEI